MKLSFNIDDSLTFESRSYFILELLLDKIKMECELGYVENVLTKLFDVCFNSWNTYIERLTSFFYIIDKYQYKF